MVIKKSQMLESERLYSAHQFVSMEHIIGMNMMM